MRVECEIEETTLQGDYADIPSVRATCDRCGHCTEAFGTSDRSVRRCLVAMRDECPNGESNFYAAESAAASPWSAD